jgi:hypothetical protein
VQVHRFIIPTENRQLHWWLLCSDLHIGSVNFDVQRWRRDMDAARSVGANVLINGDIFDAINCKDKRYDPSVLVPELRGERDIQGTVVKMAFEYLKPYADLLRVIGGGNHEMKWTDDAGNDVTARLKEQLQAIGSPVLHGGTMGYIETIFRFGKGDKVPSTRHVLLYYHGTGSAGGRVGKGVAEFHHRSTEFEYDAVTAGHTHDRTFTDSVMIKLSLNGHVTPKERKAIRTGSYYQNYKRNGQKDPLDFSYAEKYGMAPKPLGGMFLRLKPVREHIGKGTNRTVIHRVEQEVMTSP